MVRVRPLFVGAVLALSLASCGGGSGEPGWTTFAGDGLHVTYPSAWKRQKDLERDKLVFAVFSPSANGAVTRLTVKVGPSTSVSAAQLAGGTGDERAIELGGRYVSDHQMTMPGASGGSWRVVTDWTLKGDDGQDVPARVIDVVARAGDREYDVSISGPRTSLESPGIDQIIRSLRLDD